MHSIFSATLQTDRDKKFVRDNKQDFDAQTAHKKLHGFHATSAGFRISASDMLSFMTSAKFESCKGSTESFMLNWQYQDRLHESLVDSDRYFSEIPKETTIRKRGSFSETLAWC